MASHQHEGSVILIVMVENQAPVEVRAEPHLKTPHVATAKDPGAAPVQIEVLRNYHLAARSGKVVLPVLHARLQIVPGSAPDLEVLNVAHDSYERRLREFRGGEGHDRAHVTPAADDAGTNPLPA
jgi:hypothetical protein